MHAPSSLTETTVSPGSRSAEGTRLHGLWFVSARVVWVVVVVFTLSIFIASLPAYFAQLRTVCAGVTCVYAYGQLTPGTAQALQNLGLSTGGYAVSILALAIASALVSFGIACVLFWRRSADWMAMFVSLFLVTFGVNFSVQAQAILATNVQTAWYWSLDILIGLGWASLSLLLYLFPDGRFVPRWTRLLAVFVVASNILLNASPVAISAFPPWMLSAIFLINGVSGVIAQIYRYIRVSDPVQRQQTKWVVFGLAATAVVILGRDVPLLIFPSLSTSNSPYFLLSTYVYPLGLLLIPLTLGFAILRYRLWDIDILINRTLVYSTLTGLLGLIYVCLVVVLQALFKGVTGQLGASPVVIVISTLAIAALFQPLRRRIQKIIDRRFFRRKYDAARTLAAFSATLRNEVDLTELSEQLVAVVEETMQPASVSLWLRSPSQERRPGTNQLSQLNGVPGKEETYINTPNQRKERNITMNTPLRTLIERNFAAVEAKDLEAVLRCFAQDAVLIDPHYPSPVMIGKAAITDGLRWAFKGMKRFGFTIVSYGEWADGQHAAVEMATHHVLQTGMQLVFPQAFFIDAHNDLITRIQAYEPYGLGGMVLGVTRFQRRLRGQRSLRIDALPATVRHESFGHILV